MGSVIHTSAGCTGEHLNARETNISVGQEQKPDHLFENVRKNTS